MISSTRRMRSEWVKNPCLVPGQTIRFLAFLLLDGSFNLLGNWLVHIAKADLNHFEELAELFIGHTS